MEVIIDEYSDGKGMDIALSRNHFYAVYGNIIVGRIVEWREGRIVGTVHPLLFPLQLHAIFTWLRIRGKLHELFHHFIPRWKFREGLNDIRI